MTYIEALNQFWTIREDVRFSSTEADLYYCLLHKWNRLQRPNAFEYANYKICADIGISENTLKDARNRLKQKELIDFEPGRKKEKSPVYQILYLKNCGINLGKTSGINLGKTHHIKEEIENREEREEDYTSPTNSPADKSGQGGEGGGSFVSKETLRKNTISKNTEQESPYAAMLAVGGLPPVGRSPKPKKTPKPKAPPFQPDGAMVAGWSEAKQLYPITFNTLPAKAEEQYYRAIQERLLATGKPTTELTKALNARIQQFAAENKGKDAKFIRGFQVWLENRGWELLQVMEVKGDDDGEDYEAVMQRIRNQ